MLPYLCSTPKPRIQVGFSGAVNPNGLKTIPQLYPSHMALDGQTPAERAGIQVKAKDKGLTLIQNAAQKDAQSQKS
jgi:hypothetical protein